MFWTESSPCWPPAGDSSKAFAAALQQSHLQDAWIGWVDTFSVTVIFPLDQLFFQHTVFQSFCYFGCGHVMVSGFPRMELDDYKAEGVSVDAGLSFNDNSDIVTLIDSKGTDGWWVCLLFFEFYKEHHLDDSAWNCSYSLCDLEQGH